MSHLYDVDIDVEADDGYLNLESNPFLSKKRKEQYCSTSSSGKKIKGSSVQYCLEFHNSAIHSIIPI